MPGKKMFTGTGKRLKQLRKEWGMTAAEMAKHLEVSDSTYYKNECGKFTPDVGTILKLVEKNDIALDWFLLARGPKCFDKEREQVEAQKQKLDQLEKEKKAWLRTETDYKENEKHHREELKKMKSRVQTETREKVEAEKTKALEKKLRKELTPKLEAELRESLTPELKAELKKEITAKLEPQLRQELETEVREEVEPRVTAQLTEAHEKALAEGTAAIFTRKEIKDLLAHMDRTPLLYYEIMVHFENFRLQHQELVEKN